MSQYLNLESYFLQSLHFSDFPQLLLFAMKSGGTPIVGVSPSASVAMVACQGPRSMLSTPSDADAAAKSEVRKTNFTVR